MGVFPTKQNIWLYILRPTNSTLLKRGSNNFDSVLVKPAPNMEKQYNGEYYKSNKEGLELEEDI